MLLYKKILRGKKRNHGIEGFLFILMVLFSFPACEKNLLPEEGKPGTIIGSDEGKPGTIIGSDGGIVYSEDQMAWVKFPLGALSKDAEVSLILQNSSLEGNLGNSYFLKIAGAAIKKPVKVNITYNPADLPAETVRENLRLGIIKLARWQVIPDSVSEPENNSVQGEISNPEKDKLMGVILDDFPPRIISRSPEKDDTNVERNISKISLSFDEKIDPESVSEETISLSRKKGKQITGKVNLLEAGKTLEFKLEETLAKDTPYLVTVKAGIKDEIGNELSEDETYEFTTGSKRDLINPQAIESTPAQKDYIPIPLKISVRFSEEINRNTVDNASFLLKECGAGDKESICSRQISGEISYANLEADFIPQSTLKENTTYEVQLTKKIEDLAGNPLDTSGRALHTWKFTTTGDSEVTGCSKDTESPYIVEVKPSDKEEDVILLPQITARFNEPLDDTTVSNSFILLSRDNLPLAATTDYNNQIATLNPKGPLKEETKYKLKLTTGISDLCGNSLREEYIWSFTTGTERFLPPTVRKKSPGAGKSSVPITLSAVEVTFSKGMDETTINNTSFRITDPQGAQATGNISYDPETNKATYQFVDLLDYDTVYTITLTTEIKDNTQAKLPLASETSWSFTTESLDTIQANSPSDKESNVAVNSVITVNFNIALDPSTIESPQETFILKKGEEKIAGYVTYDEQTKRATFNPDAELEYETTYTAAILKEVRGDFDEILLTSDYLWEFTTAGLEVFGVESILPADNASDVPLNTKIRITFTKPFKPETIGSSSFRVEGTGGPVKGTIDYTSDNLTAIFTPDAPLSSYRNTVTLTTAIRDAEDNPLSAEYTFNFSTSSEAGKPPPSQWKIYNTANTQLVSDYIRVINIDSNNNKWIGTNNGASKFDGTQWTAYNTSADLGGNLAVNVIELEKPYLIWFGTNQGVKKFDTIGNSWTSYTTSNSGLSNNLVTSLAFEKNNKIWIGTNGGGVSVFDVVNNNWQTYNTDSGLTANQVFALKIDSQGNVWAGTSGGVSMFNGDSWKNYTSTDSGLINNQVNSLAFDSQGRIWFATAQGISVLDDKSWTIYTKDDTGLSTDTINAVAVDKSDNIWFGSNRGGVAQWTGTNWLTYTAAEGLSDNTVTSVALDAQNNKWFATSGGGVSVLFE